MTVSVVITCYNLEKFIADAVASALDQTVKANEVIVVDDGSTDKSAEVIKGFGNKVKLIRMPQNSGVLPAFVTGLRAATGDVLAFLDGDDVWMPDKLEKVTQAFAADERFMMVTHLHVWMDEKGGLLTTEDATHRNCRRIDAITQNTEERDALIKNSLLCYKGIWLGSAFAIRRRDLDLDDYEKWAYGLPGRELSHQDQPIAAYLIYKNPGKLICLLNEVLFKYRQFPNNSSGASTTVQSALKTIARSYATHVRTSDIVKRKPAWKEENYAQSMRLLELEFYRDLYMNQRGKALGKYLKLFTGFWGNAERLKETKRYLLCAVIGPSRFLALKTKRRFS